MSKIRNLQQQNLNNRLESLTNDQRTAIKYVLITLSFKAGELIMNEGDQKGEIEIYKGSELLSIIYQGYSLGEYLLQSNQVREANLKAHKDFILLALSRYELQRNLGDKTQTIIYQGQQKWTFECPPIKNYVKDNIVTFIQFIINLIKKIMHLNVDQKLKQLNKIWKIIQPK